MVIYFYCSVLLRFFYLIFGAHFELRYSKFSGEFHRVSPALKGIIMFKAIRNMEGRRVILASASPRRKEILLKLVGWGER
jgi:hypothetical protein